MKRNFSDTALFLLVAAAIAGALPNAVIAQAQDASANVSDEMTDKLTAYQSCIGQQVLRLEPSNASFADIMLASRTACAEDWFAAYSATVDHFQTLPPSPTGQSADAVAFEFMDSPMTSNEDELRLIMLQRRALRNLAAQ